MIDVPDLPTLVNGFETMLRCTYSRLRRHMDIRYYIYVQALGSKHLGPCQWALNDLSTFGTLIALEHSFKSVEEGR